MYLKRKIDDFLIKWKEDINRKPLIVKGARQIGKTESIMHFANANYTSIIYINFALDKRFIKIAEDGYDVNTIVKNISLINPSFKFVQGNTIIFFDEIQEYPDIATALKSFRIDGRYDIICSGSMLGINYRKIHSNSVGNKTDYEMFSMDFEEFLWAKGYDNTQIYSILEHMTAMRPFGETELSVYKALFLDYCVLGGMPDVVKGYIESGTFQASSDIQNQIRLDYEEDVRKYAQGLDQTKIISVYRSIPAQLAKENKKFQISKVASGARFKDYRGCIEWLNDAGIINICYCLHFPELPLRGNYDDTKMKVYFADSGLLVALLDEEAQEDLRANKNLGVYKGALYENVVGEALVKSGYELYYYKREDSTLEEDFFVRTASELIPVEVKAKSGKENDRYPEIHHGIKLTGGNVGFSDNVYTFPYFCTFLMKRYLKSDPFSGSEER